MSFTLVFDEIPSALAFWVAGVMSAVIAGLLASAVAKIVGFPSLFESVKELGTSSKRLFGYLRFLLLHDEQKGQVCRETWQEVS